MTTTVYLNIGSNIGDRRAHVARAVAVLSTHPFFSGARITFSQPYASAPWGYESDSEYLNLGVALILERSREWCATSLHTLLDAVQQCEREAGASPHRNADGTYRDRTLDIDIIAVDTLAVATPRLELPHPHMHERPFVAVPMAELAPGWTHPRLHLPIERIVENIP